MYKGIKAEALIASGLVLCTCNHCILVWSLHDNVNFFYYAFCLEITCQDLSMKFAKYVHKIFKRLFCHYKYRTIINNISDDFQLLDNKWSYKAWVSSTQEINLTLLPCMYFYMVNYTLKKAVTKPWPKSANLVSISSTWNTPAVDILWLPLLPSNSTFN